MPYLLMPSIKFKSKCVYQIKYTLSPKYTKPNVGKFDHDMTIFFFQINELELSLHFLIVTSYTTPNYTENYLDLTGKVKLSNYRDNFYKINVPKNSNIHILD